MYRLMLLLLCLALSACASDPVIPPELQYRQPEGDPSRIATLRGSQENVALLDDFTAYVLGIDGLRVMAGRKGWNTDINVTPGRHRIVAAFQRGVFNTTAALDLDAAEGGHYEIRYTSDVQLYGASSYCDFWIVDLAAQKAVTPIVRGSINGGRETVPVFIPARR